MYTVIISVVYMLCGQINVKSVQITDISTLNFATANLLLLSINCLATHCLAIYNNTAVSELVYNYT